MSASPVDSFLAVSFQFPPWAVGLGLGSLALTAWWIPHRPKAISIPGPPSLPLIGILYHVASRWKDFPAECVALTKKFGKAWGGPMLQYGVALFVVDPAGVQYVLKDNFQNYVKGDHWRNVFRELLGKGIFSADGTLWETHRKIASRLFSKNLVKYSSEVVNRNCDIIEEQWDKALQNKSDETISLDIQDLFYRLTIDSSSETTFGYKLHSLQGDHQPVFADAFDEMQELCLERFVDPLFPIKRIFQFTSTREQRIPVLQRVLNDFCYEVLDEKRRNAGKEVGEDLMSLFLKFKPEADDVELRDVILNMMVAGRDTTAAALSWTVFELTRPGRGAMVDRIVAEVKSICVQGDYSIDKIQQLSYLHAFVMEVLRLHPSVPVDGKFSVKADILPDGTKIPAGAMVVYAPYAMGRFQDNWGPDAEEFNPERFVERKEPSTFLFTAFNAGPRLCLGRSQALVTIKTTIARLMSKYEIKDVQGHSGNMAWQLVGKMEGGFPVQVHYRGPQA